MNPPFAIGQKVIAIITPDDQPTYKKGDIRIVHNLIFHCNSWFIDIGLSTISGNGTLCPFCHKSLNHNYKWYCRSEHFVAIKHDDATSEILEKFKQTDEKPDVIKIKELI